MPIRKKKVAPAAVIEDVAEWASVPEPTVNLIDHLLSLREAVDAEAELHPDRVKYALATLASAIHALQDALWTEAALEGYHA